MNYYGILIAIILSIPSLAFAIKPEVSSKKNALFSKDILPKKVNATTDNYQYCFKNSTWIVPPETLLAYLYENANLVSVADQTVWVFSNYNKGYFSGISYTSLNNNILSQRYLIGSVTSEGRVLITFYSGTSTSTDLVNGSGTLKLQSSGQCSFIMQMNSGQNGINGLTHWSYMIPVNPGDFYYDNLPSTGMSVPEFLAQF